jgi:uncharacterized membrane protein YdbT with pleckstrin-like domain
MEEDTVPSGQQYYPLGNKTLFMLIFKKSGLLFLLFLVLIASIVFLNYIPYDYLHIAINAVFIFIGVFFLMVVLVFFAGWLEYIHYGIFIEEKNLKIKKGFISEEMTGIPYRRIKDVKIERGIISQLFSVSDIIITILGSDDDDIEKEFTIFLPALPKNIALDIQDTILKKAQVEQIDVLSGHDNILNKLL